MKASRTPPVPAANDIRSWIEGGRPHAALDVLVTPELAGLMMEYNRPGDTNRKLNRVGVAAMSQALRAGAWENTGEPVIFSDAQLLNDGQHRLQAIMETGIPARVDLRFGIPRHAFAATNSGGKRSGATALLITGSLNVTNVSALARLVLAYEAGLPYAARQRIPNGSIVRAVERWPDISTSIRYASSLPPGVRNSATHTLAFFAQRTANEASVRGFFGILETGAGQASNPPHMLREALIRHRGGQDTGTRLQFLAMGILAWNAWRKPSHGLRRLDWRTGQPFPRVDDLVL